MTFSSRRFNQLRFGYLIFLLIVMVWYFVNRFFYEVFAMGDILLIRYHFIICSFLIVILAAINYLGPKTSNPPWASRFLLFLFIAMIFGFLGDFLLGNFLNIPIEPLLLGVPAFFVGQIFYLLALRTQSPLLFKPPEQTSQGTSSLILRNLLVLIGFNIIGLVLFFTTIYNPSQLTLGIGFLVYGLFFLSVLAFSFTKLLGKRIQEVRQEFFFYLGLLLFFASDYILGINRITLPILFASLIIHGFYLPGQLLIHLSPLFLKANE